MEHPQSKQEHLATSPTKEQQFQAWDSPATAAATTTTAAPGPGPGPGPGPVPVPVPSPAPPLAWTCPYCFLRSPQNDSSAFWRHFESLHKDVLETHIRSSPADASDWRQALLQQAFANQNEISDHKHFLPHPVRSSTFNTEVSQFGRLSLGKDSKDANTIRAPSVAPALSQSTAVEQASRTAEASRQSSPGSQTQQQHQHGTTHRKELSRSATLASDSDFRKYTHQSREASREINAPTTDALDDHHRKRQITNSQPVSPPALSSSRQPMPLGRNRGILHAQPDSRYPDLILQPDSRGISQEQLAAEVKAIYHALTTLETKCIKLDKEQAIASQKGPISPNVWRVLIGIHRRLLNDHHDFFLASQHPSASPPLHRLALKYNMPARMWKHGIHVFLELLRHQLPHSLEFMISFIYLAYQMMSLLLETVPSFKETWIECLGDLSRYRMAVEEEDMRDRDNWGNVARYWYSAAADRLPNTGRLYHHLSILARPDSLQQNFLFTKSLIAAQPFVSARESIQTLYDPIVKDGSAYISATDAAFIKTSAFIFYRRNDQVGVAQDQFLKLLPSTIALLGVKWRVCGVYVACVTIGALLDYGIKNTMLQVIEVGNYVAKHSEDAKDLSKFAPQGRVQTEPESEKVIEIAESFFFSTFNVVFARSADPNIYTYAHFVLCFLLTLVKYDQHLQTSPELQARSRRFLQRVPWDDVCRLLNTLLQSGRFESRFEVAEFLRPQAGDRGRLPEDFALRGMIFSTAYFPDDFFHDIYADDDRTVEYPSTARTRGERILWIGYQLSRYACLKYNSAQKTWQPNLAAPWIRNVASQQDAGIPDKDVMDIEIVEPVPESIEDIDIEKDGGAAVRKLARTPEVLDSAVAINALSKEDTLLVLDAKVSLKHNDIFSHLVANSWHVAVFADLPKRLRQLSKKHEPFDVANFSEIEKKVNATDTTAHALDKEGQMVCSFHSVPSELVPSPTSDDKDDDDWQDVLITRRASTLHLQNDTRKFALFILVTDDDAIIAYAQQAGVQVVTSEYIRATLMSSNDGTRSQASSDDALEGKAVSP